MSSLPPITFEDEDNPYRAPETHVRTPSSALDEADRSGAEVVRQANIKHEASVKAVGWLNYIGGSLTTLLGLLFVAAASGIVTLPDTMDDSKLVLGIIAAFALGFGVLGLFLGHGLRMLQPWARWTTGVVVSLQAFLNLVGLNPVGLLICGYIAFLMFSSKSTLVFSPEYKEIIAQTPHIRYKTSLAVKILLVVLLVVLALLVLAAIFAGF